MSRQGKRGRQRPESRTGMVAIVPLWIAGALALGCFVHAQ